MPRAREHLYINLVALTTFELTAQLVEIQDDPNGEIDWGRLLVNVAAGTAASALPDLLEPSLGNPNHRGFCHSLAAATLVWWAVSGEQTRALSPQARQFLNMLAAGYTAHLAADFLFSKRKGMGFVCAQF